MSSSGSRRPAGSSAIVIECVGRLAMVLLFVAHRTAHRVWRGSGARIGGPGDELSMKSGPRIPARTELALNGDPTSRGWPKVRRPRQRGPDTVVCLACICKWHLWRKKDARGPPSMNATGCRAQWAESRKRRVERYLATPASGLLADQRRRTRPTKIVEAMR
jgi:hypothetical protein